MAIPLISFMYLPQGGYASAFRTPMSLSQDCFLILIP